MEELQADTLQQAIKDEARTLVVDFWSPWCAPCRTLRPHLARLAEGHEDRARFVALNVESAAELAEALEVRALPTVAIYSDGAETQRFTGASVLAGVRAALEALD